MLALPVSFAGAALLALGCASAREAPVALAPRLALEHGSPVASLAFSPDSSTLLVGGGPAPRAWEIPSGCEHALFEQVRFDAHSDNTRCAVFSADGQLVAAAADGGLVLLDAETGRVRSRFEAARMLVETLALSADGARLYCAGDNQVSHSAWRRFIAPDPSIDVCAWDIASGQILWTRPVVGITRPSASVDGALLAVHHFHGDLPLPREDVDVWNLGNETCQLLTSHSAVAYDAQLVFSPDRQRLAAVSAGGSFLAWAEDENAVLWELAGGHILTQLVVGPAPKSACLAFSKDGELVAMGRAGGAVTLLDVQTRRALASVCDVDRPPDVEVVALAFSPDGTYLAAGRDDGHVSVWELAQVLSSADLGARSQAGSPAAPAPARSPVP